MLWSWAIGAIISGIGAVGGTHKHAQYQLWRLPLVQYMYLLTLKLSHSNTKTENVNTKCMLGKPVIVIPTLSSKQQQCITVGLNLVSNQYGGLCNLTHGRHEGWVGHLGWGSWLGLDGRGISKQLMRTVHLRQGVLSSQHALWRRGDRE